MYKNKNTRRWLAVIGKRSLASLIALCMLFSFAPAVFSEGIELTEEVITDIIPEVTETEATEEVTALSEITEMRDEFSKTFLMSDGTYTQVSYSSPVHYEDEEGVYQEIDNRLSVNAMTGKVTTGNGGTNVAFSQSQPQVSIDADGHNISWTIEKKSDLAYSHLITADMTSAPDDNEWYLEASMYLFYKFPNTFYNTNGAMLEAQFAAHGGY